jgi:cysteine desulfuration protein SufE
MLQMRNTALQTLIDDFSLFEDWEGRYRYLIDLGRTLPTMDESLKTEETLVRGCTSRVWMVPEIKDGRFYFQADSDAHIVRGLVAILHKVYNGVKLSEISDIDIEGAFAQIGLDQNLSPNRRSGFFAMVERVRGMGNR